MILSVICVAPARAIDTSPAPPILPNSPLLFTAYFIETATPHYIELYNSSSDLINIRDWKMTMTWSSIAPGTPSAVTTPLSLKLSNSDQYIPAKSYAVVGFGDAVNNPSIHVDALTGQPGEYISQLQLENPSYQPYTKYFSSAQTAPMRLKETSTGYTSTGNYSAETRSSLYDNGLYEVGISSPASVPLQVVEVLANPRTCSPLETDTACREYVKLYNPTDGDISFENTRLHIGSMSSSGTTVHLGGVIKAGSNAVFSTKEDGSDLSISNGGGYVWLEDTYGLKIYDNTVMAFEDATSSIHKGQSWALIDGQWQWATPSPSGANLPLPPEPEQTTPATTSIVQPCRSDQYRNPLTNRCKLIEVSDSSLTPCAANQYRSPETNRCRLVNAASSSSSLTPCAANQYRSTETNRCRLVSTASTSSLKPCATNQERNPDTNRCRNITSSQIPQADFAVQTTADPPSQTIGWLAFAGVAGLAASYGVWEWRREIGSKISGVAGRLTKGNT